MKSNTLLISLLLISLLVGCHQNTDITIEKEQVLAPSLDWDYFDTQSIALNELTTDSEAATDRTRSITRSPVYLLLGEEMITVGESKLSRGNHMINMKYEFDALPKNHAYTIWAVVFNNPEHCATLPCSAADLDNPDVLLDALFIGGAVTPRGFGHSKAVVTGGLREGDTSGSLFGELFNLPSVGLLDTRKAEVHLILRSHGPKIRELVREQTTSYSGGCFNPLPDFTEIPDEPGECADIMGSIHLGSGQ